MTTSLPFVQGDTRPLYTLRLPSGFDVETPGRLFLTRNEEVVLEIEGYVSELDPLRMLFSPTPEQSASLTEDTYRLTVRLVGPIVQTPVVDEVLTVLRAPALTEPT